MSNGLRKISRRRAMEALRGVKFPVKLSLRQKSDLVMALIEEKRMQMHARQEELLTAEAIQARKEAEDAANAEVPAPEGI